VLVIAGLHWLKQSALDNNMTIRIFVLCLALATVVRPAHAQTPLGFRAALAPPDTRITLEQFGLLVTITADGSVALEGETGFEFDISQAKERITREELNELILAFTRIGYLSMNDNYDRKEDGCPRVGPNCSTNGIVTSFTFNGKSKRIVHTVACPDRDGLSYPRELTKLEEQIKDVAGLKRQ